MTSCDLDTSVPDWVIEHPETLAAFQEWGIDYSCGGKSLEYACREQGLVAASILSKLHSLIGDGHITPSLKATLPVENDAMSIQPAQPNERISLPLGAALANSKSTTLVKMNHLELIRLVLTAGQEIPSHTAPGEITVQCLEGRIALTAWNRTQELTAGQLLYLAAGEPHALKGLEASSVLVTLLRRP